MVQYPINVKVCEAAIMVIASVQGGQTHTMAAKPQWWTCHTVQQCTIKTKNTILSANFAKTKNVKPGAYENKV